VEYGPDYLAVGQRPASTAGFNKRPGPAQPSLPLVRGWFATDLEAMAAKVQGRRRDHHPRPPPFQLPPGRPPIFPLHRPPPANEPGGVWSEGLERAVVPGAVNSRKGFRGAVQVRGARMKSWGLVGELALGVHGRGGARGRTIRPLHKAGKVPARPPALKPLDTSLFGYKPVKFAAFW